MRPPQGSNWIGGRRTPAASEHEFEPVALLPPYGPRGRWPRSAEGDLRAALEAAEEAGQRWAGLGRGERLASLLGAAEALEGDEGLAARLAPGLGQPLGPVAERLAEDLFRLREALELHREGSEVRPGVGLFQAHWSDLAGPLASRLAPRLLAGATAVVVADPRLPEAADALGQALASAGLPPGVVAVLHDDGHTVLQAALRDPLLAWVRLRGPAETVQDLARERGGGAPGAGPVEWSLWQTASAVHVVRADADPAVEAERVVERGLSASATLCGQLPDAIGRVLCHQRQLSRFTEELLARLEARPDLERPVPLVERELFDWLREAWALGLDEGAAPIWGAAPTEAARQLARSEGAAAAVPATTPAAESRPGPAAEVPRGRAPRAVRPMVFTNVEADGRLIGLGRPAPLLRLVRLASDEEALRLRDALAPPAGHSAATP